MTVVALTTGYRPEPRFEYRDGEIAAIIAQRARELVAQIERARLDSEPGLSKSGILMELERMVYLAESMAQPRVP